MISSGGFAGSEINICDPNAFSSGRGEVVIVSGDFPNLCGHALLNVVGYGFLHIAGSNARPRHLKNFMEFERYVSENKKTVLGRYFF